MKNIAIIPARGGSKGIKFKNLAPLDGVPLIDYTIIAALKSEIFDLVVVSTENTMIRDYLDDSINTLKEWKQFVYVIKRKDELAKDETPIDPVIEQTLKDVQLEFDILYDNVFTLQVTSPLRNGHHIVKAFKIFNETKADSLVSVVEERHSIWKANDFNGFLEPVFRPMVNRQLIRPRYRGNGAITITKCDKLLNYGQRVVGRVVPFVMSERDSVDIHTKEDMDLAQYYLSRGGWDEDISYW